jgi:cobalt-zinc-cadmium efflux system protein
MTGEVLSGGARHTRRLKIVLALTAAFMIVEAAGGVLTGSLALLADAAHMLTDVFGLSLALFAIWFGAKPPTSERTFGFYRAEVLAAAANAILLFAVAGYIFLEAWQRFRTPEPIQTGPMLVVAIGGLGINLLSVVLLRSASEDSLNVQGAYFEVLDDLLGSVGVIVAALVVRFTGWYYADPVISVAIGLFILPRTWKLLREALAVLLEGAPSHVDVVELERAIASVPGVVAVHDLHVWSLTSGVHSMSGHVVVESPLDGDDVRRRIESLLRGRHKIEHTTIQVETGEREPAEPGY